MNEQEKTIADIRARIAALRSRLEWSQESNQGVESRQETVCETNEVLEQTPEMEQRQKRNADLDEIKKKLTGFKK